MSVRNLLHLNQILQQRKIYVLLPSYKSWTFLFNSNYNSFRCQFFPCEYRQFGVIISYPYWKKYIFVPKVCPVKMHVFRFANIIYPDLLVANLACWTEKIKCREFWQQAKPVKSKFTHQSLYRSNWENTLRIQSSPLACVKSLRAKRLLRWGAREDSCIRRLHGKSMSWKGKSS